MIDELPKGVRELAFGKRFAFKPDEIFVIGGSFGGAAAILASLDDRVKKVIANCPVVDWAILAKEEGWRLPIPTMRRIFARRLAMGIAFQTATGASCTAAGSTIRLITLRKSIRQKS